MVYSVWYMKPEFFRDGIMGFDWCTKKGLLPDPTNLNKTHVYLMQRDVPDLESLFYQMQGEVWSPNGEACALIKGKGVHHTSMSVGDVAVDATGQVYMADRFGFQNLTTPEPSAEERRRIADRIDGFDRDDLGESQDY